MRELRVTEKLHLLVGSATWCHPTLGAGARRGSEHGFGMGRVVYSNCVCNYFNHTIAVVLTKVKGWWRTWANKKMPKENTGCPGNGMSCGAPGRMAGILER